MSTVVDDRQPLVVLNARGSRPPLYCMHPVGGHLNAYLGLGASLDPDQPLYALRSRAQVAPQLEHPTISAMAEDYATVVQGAHPGGPYRLFGWSMGGLTAHAVACELERRGEHVDFVGMVDPQIGPLRATADDLRIAMSMAIQIFHPSPPPGSMIRSELRQLELREADPAIVGWCVARGLLPEGVSVDEFVGAIGLFPVHRDLVSGHHPGVCRAPMIVWKARDISREPHDWSRHTTGTCTINALDGDHFSIMRSPRIDAIAADLRSLKS